MQLRSIFGIIPRPRKLNEGLELSNITPPKHGRVDCIGIIRFSVLSTVYNKFEDWVGQPFEEYAKVILNEDRLQARFSLFEHIALPSYDSQTDKHFSLLLVAPRLLPQHWKERLTSLCCDRDYIVVHYAHEDNFRLSNLTSMIVRDLIGSTTIFSTFRTDDDDAVSATFIERLRAHHTTHLVGYGVSFTSGYYLDLSAKSNRVAIKPKDRKNTGAGLAFVSSVDKPVGLFDLSDGHLNYHKLRPVVIDGRDPNFIVLNHEFNDTKDKRHARKHPLSPAAAQQKLLEKNFHIDLVGLMAERSKKRPTIVTQKRNSTTTAKEINLYWWSKKKNFGDLIGPWLVKMITGRTPVNIFDDQTGAVGLLTAGSLVHSINRPGLEIWGGGAIRPLSKSVVKALKSRAPARVHALRGLLTLREIEKLGWEKPKAFGDPALLLPRYYSPERDPTLAGRVGILPHYTHKPFFDGSDERFHVIDVQDEPQSVIDQITSCTTIISTSLHGVVCAHAYGIPWSWMHIVDSPLRGDRFKFEDFFTLLHRDAVSEITVRGDEVLVNLEAAARQANLPRDKDSTDALLEAFPLHYGLTT